MVGIAKNRWRIVSIALAGVLAMLLSACGGGGSDDGGTPSDDLVVGLSYRTSGLDPHKGGPYDNTYTAPIYDSLIGWDEEGNPVPALATAWELADDAMSLTLTLREDVVFQDGATMDAEAVIKSLDRARAEGASTAGALSNIDTIETVEPLKIKLNFKAPGGHIIKALGKEPGMIVSPNVVDGDVAGNPTGAGPFKLVSQSPDVVEYEAWDGYWDAENREPTKLTIRAIVDDSARVRALNSGQIDMGNMRPSNITEIESAGNEIITGPYDTIYWIILNTTVPGLDNGEVRKALMHAIDRDSINENLQNGLCEPIVQPYIDDYSPFVEQLANEESLAYTPEESKAALADAGFGEGNPLTLSIKNVGISVYQELAEVLQDQWSQIGIESTVTSVESSQSTPEVQAGNFQVYVAPTRVTAPDESTFLYNWYLRPSAPWLANFTIDGGQDLIDEARSSIDPAAQAEPLKELSQKIYDAGAPSIPICAPQAVIGASPGLEGMVTPIGFTYNFKPVVVNR